MENKKQKKRPTLCIELLNTFSNKELEGFAEFISCRYFNTDKLVIQLFKALQKYVVQQHFFGSILQYRVYEFVFKRKVIYKDQLNNAQKTELNRKLNLLLRLAEEFISINSLKQNNYGNLDYLYPELLKRKRYSLLKRHFNKTKEIFKNEPVKDIVYYENWALFNELYLQYLNNTQKVDKENNIESCITATDLSFLLRRLSLYQSTLALNKYYANNIDAKMYQPVNDLMALKPYKSNLQIRTQQMSIDMLTSMTEKKFKDFLAFIKKEGDEIGKTDLVALYNYGINFCSSQIRKGNLSYYETSFKLYFEMHQQNLLLNDNFIHSIVYTNIVITACRANQILWAQKLSQYYQPYLIKNIKESIYNYNLGLIAFFQNDYTKAHHYFISTDRTNSFIDYNVRLYILKCLFESSDDFNHHFLQYIRSTKEFFKQQKKLPPNLKKGFINFLSILPNIYNYKNGKRKISIVEIKQKLSAMDYVSFRAWLREKISVLQ